MAGKPASHLGPGRSLRSERSVEPPSAIDSRPREAQLLPQVLLDLQLIQASTLEMDEQLERESTENPFLERDEDSPELSLRLHQETEPVPQRTPRGESESEEGAAWYEAGPDTPWTREEIPADESSEPTAILQLSPREQIQAEIRELELPSAVSRIASELVGYLDESGFLSIPEGNLFREVGLSTEAERTDFERALRALRFQVEPPGLGARDVHHCFLIQLESQGKSDSLAAELLREGSLASIKDPRELPRLAKVLGRSESELMEALKDLNGLYPHPLPLLDLIPEPTRYPDLIAQKVEGGWEVDLNDRLRERYRFRNAPVPTLRALLKETGGSEEDAARVIERLKHLKAKSRMLVRAVEHRDRILSEVGRLLVQEQAEFLEEGPSAWKPLRLEELAQKLGLNEASLARILRDKHIATPRGLIPLTEFFSVSGAGPGDQPWSPKVVLDALSRLLQEEEDPAHPWSDHAIAEILTGRGLPIGRRTVTSYRRTLKIGPAAGRRAHQVRGSSGRSRPNAARESPRDSTDGRSQGLPPSSP